MHFGHMMLPRRHLILACMLVSGCVRQPAQVTLVPSATPAATPTPGPSPTPLPTLPPTPAAAGLDIHASAMLPQFAGDLAALANATRYWIEIQVQFDPLREMAVIEGLARIRFVNPGQQPLSDVVVMLWPNDLQYQAEMHAGPALIDGRLQPPNAELQGLAQRYELPRPLPPGEAVDLSLPFHVDTSGPIGGGAPRRFGISEGVLFAPTFYPLLPLLRDGEWVVERAPAGGDTTNSAIAFYQVRVATSVDHEVVATGIEVGREQLPDGTQAMTFVSGPVRDFAFAIGTLVSETKEVQGVQIRGWVLPEHQPDLTRMVEAAAAQVELLARLVGPYRYVELDLVDLPGAYGGIEYPGLVTIGTLGGPDLIHPTVHEVGHQWFYGLIGDDQLREPWLDEAAATYTQVLYLEQTEGSGSATGLLSDYREALREHPEPERPIGLGVADYASQWEYALFVYLKGALFFDALRTELGDKIFFEFLQAYYEDYRYKIATAVDFQSTAEATCACDLQALFDLWVYRGGELPGL
ncbi:MAG: M1 family metallopeptidase [Chloroflexota bacterium]